MLGNSNVANGGDDPNLPFLCLARLRQEFAQLQPLDAL